MDIELVIVGSGQDGGSPQFGSRRGTGPARTASSIAVIADSQTVLLFDATPDLRQQYALITERTAGRTAKDPVDAVFVTHAHMGHYGGLVHFGKEAANTNRIPLHGPMSLLEFVHDNEPWASLLRNENMVGHATEDCHGIYGPITVEALPVPHRAELSTAVAYSVVVEGEPWALYLPDIDNWEAWPEARSTIQRHRVCLLDATFAHADEVDGRDLSAIPHPMVDDTIAVFGDLTDETHVVLTHLNHTNRVADPDSAEYLRATNAGFTIAHDGMVLGFDGHRG